MPSWADVEVCKFRKDNLANEELAAHATWEHNSDIIVGFDKYIETKVIENLESQISCKIWSLLGWRVILWNDVVEHNLWLSIISMLLILISFTHYESKHIVFTIQKVEMQSKIILQIVC